jgi:transcriptional regulator with PAS, ATPase and Fis domain
VEYRIQCKDGRWIWVHDRAFRTHERDGVRYADEIFSDVTERKTAKDALAESEARFRAMVELAPDGIFVIGDTGQILEVNQAACRQLGYGRESLLKLTIFDIIKRKNVKEARMHLLTRHSQPLKMTSMRNLLLRSAVLIIMAAMLGGHVTELLDHWDHTAQTGKDSDYAVVVIAGCLGLAFAVAHCAASVFKHLRAFVASRMQQKTFIFEPLLTETAVPGPAPPGFISLRI